MSRIGLKSIEVPSGVSVSVDGTVVTVKGPKGELTQPIARELSLVQEENTIRLERPNNQRRNRAQHGLARTLINNMIEGVSKGHEKALEIHGVGYRAAVAGKVLTLSLGYSHPVEITAPAGIDFELAAEERGRVTTLFVRGIDKALVGQVAADVRKVRKPDPYKGKGVRYRGERVVLRQGKRAS